MSYRFQQSVFFDFSIWSVAKVQQFFRYLSVQGERMDWLRRTLEGLIYFSSPARFNDPFELSPHFTLPDRELIESELRLLSGISVSRTRQRKVMEGVQQRFRAGELPVVDPQWAEALGVLCLASSPSDILMWSHYGDSHRGVCVQFHGAFEPFSCARRVTYSSDRPLVPFRKNLVLDDETAEAILLTKSHHWQYEQEWRVIKRPIREEEKDFYWQAMAKGEMSEEKVAELLASEGGPGVYQFDPAAVRRIILGARADEETIDAVREMVAGRSEIKLARARLDKRHFLVEVCDERR